jgi:hypothetical protein
MEKSEYDEVVDLCAKHLVKEMAKEDWLGKTLVGNGFDLSEVSEEDAHAILIRTIIKLYNAFEEDIEIEEEEEDIDEEDEDEDEDEEDDFEDENDEESF